MQNTIQKSEKMTQIRNENDLAIEIIFKFVLF